MCRLKELLFHPARLLLRIMMFLLMGSAFHGWAQDFNADIGQAFAYYHDGRYAEAALLFEKWLPAVKEDLGENDTSIYQLLVDWTGTCYLYGGQYDKALPLKMEDARICRTVFGEDHTRYAQSLENLAGVYEVMGRYDEALKEFQKAALIFREVMGENDPEYAYALESMAWCYRQMGQLPAAGPLYEQALSIYKNTLGPESEEYQDCLGSLAGIYRDLGDYAPALASYMERVSIKRKIPVDQDQGLASSLIDLANVYTLTGNYAAALPLYEEAIHIRKTNGEEGTVDYGTCINNLGHLYQLMGDYERALPLLEEASAIYGKMDPDPFLYATSLNNLANLFQEMGNYDRSLSCYWEASGILKHYEGEGRSRYASLLNNMALLYDDLGDYEKALSLAREALSIQQELLGKDHPDIAISLDNMAMVYQDMGKYPEALPLLREALEIRKRTLGTDHPYYAASLNNLAGIYMDMGDFSSALPLYEEAEQIHKKLLGDEHPEYAVNLNNLAVLHQKMGNPDKAMAFSEEALSIRRKNLAPDHPDIAVSLNNMAMICRESGNTSKALALYSESNAIIGTNIRENFSFLSENDKKNYLKTVGFFFDIYLSFLEDFSALHPSSCGLGYDNELLRKGLILSSENARRRAIYDSGDTMIVRKFDRLSEVRKEMTGLQQQALTTLTNERIIALKNEAGELERQLGHESRDFLAIMQQFSVTFKDIQKTLLPGEAALEFTSAAYYNGDTWADSTHYCALLIRFGDSIPRMVYLCGPRQLKNSIPRPGAGIHEVDNAYKEDRGVSAIQYGVGSGAPSASLFDLVWKPLDSLLQGITTIYYAPTGQLHRVSMAAIPCPDGSLLMDRYRLVQLSSTRTLTAPMGGVNIRDAVVYGGIQYDMDTMKLMEEASRYEKSHNDLPGFETEPRGGTRTGFQFLEGTRKEADIICQEFRRNSIPVKTYAGMNALEESFLAQSAPISPAVIHIATHGFYLPDTISNKENRDMMMTVLGEERFRLSDDPLLRSGLIMAGANAAWRGEPIPAGLEDGILTAKEVSNMNLLNTELVVLSACQTGLGDVKGSEGVEGLLRGFKMAGVRYLILSLWEVPDRETVEFMEHFYGNWLGGQEIRTAFRNTQRHMHAKYPDEPYKWAAFVLVE